MTLSELRERMPFVVILCHFLLFIALIRPSPTAKTPKNHTNPHNFLVLIFNSKFLLYLCGLNYMFNITNLS